MITKRVYSENADYQIIESLRTNRNKRYKSRSFIVEGVRGINNALKYGWHIQSFLYSFERQLSGWASSLLDSTPADAHYELTNPLMEKLSGKADTSELLAVVKMREEDCPLQDDSSDPIFVLFDRPSNKGNLGTLIRSCDALGIDGLMITGHAVDMYDPDVIAATMGSFFAVPFIRLYDNQAIDGQFASLKSRYPGMKVVGTTAHGKQPIDSVDLSGPVFLLIGNETDGLNQHLVEMSDHLAAIPMSLHSSASSLNVSCAATVLLYEAHRQRNSSARNNFPENRL